MCDFPHEGSFHELRMIQREIEEVQAEKAVLNDQLVSLQNHERCVRQLMRERSHGLHVVR